MAIDSDVGSHFSANWTRYGLGPVELNFLRCSPQTVTRSLEMIARGSLRNFELLYARSGMIGVEHGSSRGLVPPGCFVLLDDQQAYRLDFPQGSDCLTVRMPEDWLLDWMAGAHDLIGRTIGLLSPWGRPLAGLLTAIADGGLTQASLSRAVIADQLGGMAGMLAGDAEDAGRARASLASRARDVIHALHADAELTPARVAAELSVGVRHLHRVLARSGDSFGRCLNAARIAAAQGILASREGRDMPIGEVAWRVGFADQSHFARLFRAAHGCSPMRYRQGSRSLTS